MHRIHSRRRDAADVRATLLAALCILVPLLAGCTETVAPDRSFSYADGNFCATVSGTVTRTAADDYTGDRGLVGESMTGVARPFEATVSFTRTAGTATLSVAYTSPPALAGVTVTRATVTEVTASQADAAASAITLTRQTADGQVIRLDLSDVSRAATDALLAPALALLPAGDVTEVSPREGGMYTVTRQTGDAETAFTFTDGSPLPTRITWTTDGQSGEMTVG